MSHQKKSKDQVIEEIKKLSDINPYVLEVTIEDIVMLAETIEQIHKLCKEAEGE